MFWRTSRLALEFGAVTAEERLAWQTRGVGRSDPCGVLPSAPHVPLPAAGAFALRHPVPMTHPLKVEIPHQLGRAEARRRIENGFENLVHPLGGRAGAWTQRWEGDRLIFSVAVMGQNASGTVDVLETVVVMEIELPGLLGQIASVFKGRLQKAGQLLLTKS